MAWIYSLSGGPSQATVVYQVERLGGDDESGGRCARADTRLTPDGWFLRDFPVLDKGPCRP